MKGLFDLLRNVIYAHASRVLSKRKKL